MNTIALLTSKRSLRFRFNLYVVSVFIALLIALAYIPALRSYFHADDFVLLGQAHQAPFNITIFGVEKYWFFYRPLGKLVWAIMYRLVGLRPAPFHLLSFVLHGVNAVLLMVFVTQFAPSKRWIAITAGMLFALFPAHVEAILWPASLYDLLATAGYLATMVCLTFWWQKKLWYWLVLGACSYQLCLWSKEVAFTLPVLAILVGLCLPARPRLSTIIASLLPLATLLAINLLQRYLAWGNIGGYNNGTLFNIAQLILGLRSDLLTLLGPVNQLLFPPIVRQICIVVSGVVLGGGLLSRANRRLMLIGFLWMLVTLLPVTSFPVGPDLQNSRLLYLPAVGFCMLVAAALDGIIQRLRRLQNIVRASAVVVLCLASLTIVWFHSRPWISAGQQTLQVVQELHRFVPVFRPQGKIQTGLQVIGLPDNYQGAYLYRIGLDLAYNELYGSFFDIERVTTFPPFHYDKARDVVQVQFTYDPQLGQWFIPHIRGVTDGTRADPDGPGKLLRWGFVDCDQFHTWTYYSVSPTCTQQGIQVSSPGNDPYLVSPRLAINSAGWTEVVVTMERSTTVQADSIMQVFWITDDHPQWEEALSDFINLPASSALNRYHFFIPPDAAGKSILQIRIDPLSSPGSAILHDVTVRSIP